MLEKISQRFYVYFFLLVIRVINGLLHLHVLVVTDLGVAQIQAVINILVELDQLHSELLLNILILLDLNLEEDNKVTSKTKSTIKKQKLAVQDKFIMFRI